MTKIVNDSYPGSLTDEQIKAKFLEDSMSGAIPTTQKIDVPTEIIELPSRGYFYPEGHPLSSGKIEMKYMTAKEEDILASQNLIKQGVVIDKLLQSLIVTKCNYNDILTIDKNAIFIAARMLSYGKDYEINVTCRNCGEKHGTVVDIAEFEEKEIDWSVFTKGQNSFEFTLPAATKNKLTLKMLTHGDEKQVEESLKAYKKLSKLTGVDSELTTRLKHTIIAVDGDTDRNNINKFVDSMLAINSLALRKFLKEVTPDIKTVFNDTCPHCGHEQEGAQLPIGVGFFWPNI